MQLQGIIRQCFLKVRDDVLAGISDLSCFLLSGKQAKQIRTERGAESRSAQDP